jgi:hypothetical protein
MGLIKSLHRLQDSCPLLCDADAGVGSADGLLTRITEQFAKAGVVSAFILSSAPPLLAPFFCYLYNTASGSKTGVAFQTCMKSGQCDGNHSGVCVLFVLPLCVLLSKAVALHCIV